MATDFPELKEFLDYLLEIEPVEAEGMDRAAITASIASLFDTFGPGGADNQGNSISWWADSSLNGKWFNLGGNHAEPSNDAPYVQLEDSEIHGLVLSNGEDDANGDIEIYVNGVLTYTWAYDTSGSPSKRTDYINGLAIVLVAGDEVSVYGQENNTTKNNNLIMFI